MIRVSEEELRRMRARRTRRALGALALAALAGGGLTVAQEVQLQRELGALPAATPGDARSIEVRLACLDALIDGRSFWLGKPRAERERGELQAELQRLQVVDAKESHGRDEGTLMADSAVVLARDLVASGRYADAVEQYRRALEAAPADWEQRERVEADLEAVSGLVAGAR